MHKVNDQATVLIVGETIDGRLSKGSIDLGQQARQLAGLFNGRAVGVIIGSNNDQAARSWSEISGITIINLEHTHCRYPNPSMTAAGVEALVDQYAPLAVCFPHSLRACQAAATLAWRIKAPCISAVESICQEKDQLALKRSVFGGKLYQTVAADKLPMILTLRPGQSPHSARPEKPDRSPLVETRPIKDSDPRFVPQAIIRRTDTNQSLENARVIVAGGRGLGKPEHTALLESVAGMFKHAAIGGSRGACDLGWLPYSRQIGETGRTVSPALYLACGISGAPQHLAGMRESLTILAVNTDPKAPIFNVANYAVIEDVTAFLPMLRERYAKITDKGDPA